MFRMLEVIGVSGESFSSAVKNGVETLLKQGEKIHFFEVIEERGAVREKSITYQVKIKVACEMASAHAEGCPTCSKSTKSGHLCAPKQSKDETCDWCGAMIPDQRHICDDKIKELSYICNSCGRTAVKAEHLCNPKKIKKS